MTQRTAWWLGWVALCVGALLMFGGAVYGFAAPTGKTFVGVAVEFVGLPLVAIGAQRVIEGPGR